MTVLFQWIGYESHSYSTDKKFEKERIEFNWILFLLLLVKIFYLHRWTCKNNSKDHSNGFVRQYDEANVDVEMNCSVSEWFHYHLCHLNCVENAKHCENRFVLFPKPNVVLIMFVLCLNLGQFYEEEREMHILVEWKVKVPKEKIFNDAQSRNWVENKCKRWEGKLIRTFSLRTVSSCSWISTVDWNENPFSHVCTRESVQCVSWRDNI